MSEFIDYDAELSPEEIKRARRIVAWEELKEGVKEYRKAKRAFKFEMQFDTPEGRKVRECRERLIALSLELFPED